MQRRRITPTHPGLYCIAGSKPRPDMTTRQAWFFIAALLVLVIIAGSMEIDALAVMGGLQ